MLTLWSYHDNTVPGIKTKPSFTIIPNYCSSPQLKDIIATSVNLKQPPEQLNHYPNLILSQSLRGRLGKCLGYPLFNPMVKWSISEGNKIDDGQIAWQIKSSQTFGYRHAFGKIESSQAFLCSNKLYHFLLRNQSKSTGLRCDIPLRLQLCCVKLKSD